MTNSTPEPWRDVTATEFECWIETFPRPLEVQSTAQPESPVSVLGGSESWEVAPERGRQAVACAQKPLCQQVRDDLR
jgi:hypothetical protein